MARPLTTLLRRCEEDAAAIMVMVDDIDPNASVPALIARFEALDSRYRGMRQRWAGVQASSAQLR